MNPVHRQSNGSPTTKILQLKIGLVKREFFSIGNLKKETLNLSFLVNYQL